jgi:hypothetical protein
MDRADNDSGHTPSATTKSMSFDLRLEVRWRSSYLRSERLWASQPWPRRLRRAVIDLWERVKEPFRRPIGIDIAADGLPTYPDCGLFVPMTRSQLLRLARERSAQRVAREAALLAAVEGGKVEPPAAG